MMNRRSAERLERRLKERYPDSDVTVDRQPGGLRIELRSGKGSSIVAVTGEGPSLILAALMASPVAEVDPAHRRTGAGLRAALEGTAPPDEVFARDISAALALVTPEVPDPWADA